VALLGSFAPLPRRSTTCEPGQPCAWNLLMLDHVRGHRLDGAHLELLGEGLVVLARFEARNVH